LIKALFGPPKIRYVFILAMLCTAVCVALLRVVGYWELSFLKVTIVWFFGASCLGALFHTARTGHDYFRRLVLSNIALSAVVDFVLSAYTFPLLVELIFVPITAILVAAQAVVSSSTQFKEPQYAPIRSLLAICLSTLGLVALAYSLVQSVAHFRLGSSALLREFLLPFLLTVAFIPYVYAVRLWSTIDLSLTMIRIGLTNEALYPAVRKAVVRGCGFSIARAEFFDRNFRSRFWGATSVSDVRTIMSEFSDEWSARRRDRGSL
jgi:hypothetical protein